ncbi:hypothetical protein R9X44_02930 [Actinocorallia sp. A-T 12471]|nr:hypothetical protein [Actinocorallia sp. A-T 12471]MDX6738705.1 hypothetical protein [Actinocorallia sp. A-T 12471]
MCTALQDHIADDALLFPQWMFAYKSLITPDQAAEPDLLPIVTKTGKIHHHVTTGARYGMNCACPECRSFAAAYQRGWRHRQFTTSTRANPVRTDGTEFLTPAVWTASGTTPEPKPPSRPPSPPTTPATPASAGPSPRASTSKKSANEPATAA